MLSIYFLAGTSGSLLIGAFNARDDPKSTLSGGPLLKFLALAAGASQVLRFVYMLVVARQVLVEFLVLFCCPCYACCMVCGRCKQFCTKVVDEELLVTMRRTPLRHVLCAAAVHTPLTLSVVYLSLSTQAPGNRVELAALVAVCCDIVVSIMVQSFYLFDACAAASVTCGWGRPTRAEEAAGDSAVALHPAHALTLNPLADRSAASASGGGLELTASSVAASGGALRSRVTLVPEPVPGTRPTFPPPSPPDDNSGVGCRWLTGRVVLLVMALLIPVATELMVGAFLRRNDRASRDPGGATVKFLALGAAITQLLRLVFGLVVVKQVVWDVVLLCFFPVYIVCLGCDGMRGLCSRLVDDDIVASMRETAGRHMLWAAFLHAPLALSLAYLVMSSQALGGGLELVALITVCCDAAVSVLAHGTFLLTCLGNEQCCGSASRQGPRTGATAVRDGGDGDGGEPVGASV